LGKNIEFVQQDDSNRRWFNEFRSKSTSTPIGLETIDRKKWNILDDIFLSLYSGI
jgi:hypothetical protein